MSVLQDVEAFKEEKEHPETYADAGPKQPNNEEANSMPAIAEPEKPLVSAKEKATELVQDTLQGAMAEKVKKGTNDIKELARDLTYLKGASDLQENDEFKEGYQSELAKQLIKDLQEEGKRAAIQEAAKKQEARNLRNQAFYNGCKPVFEMLNISEAYGLIPMIMTIVVLMIPFLIVSFARFAINAINSLFKAVSGFTKPAFWICSIVIIVMIVIAAAIGLLYLIDYLFGTSIMQYGRDLVADMPK